MAAGDDESAHARSTHHLHQVAGHLLRDRCWLQVGCRDDRDDSVVTRDPSEIVGDQPIPTYHAKAWMDDRDGLGAPRERRNPVTLLQRLLNHKPSGATGRPDNEESHSAPLSR